MPALFGQLNLRVKTWLRIFQIFHFPPTVMSLAPVNTHRKIEKKLYKEKSISSKYFVYSLVTSFSLIVLFMFKSNLLRVAYRKTKPQGCNYKQFSS